MVVEGNRFKGSGGDAGLHERNGMSNIEKDLNSTIASAVNARIEAEVVAALSGDEVIGRYVAGALRQPVGRQEYGRKQLTYLETVVREAIQGATKAAVKRVIDEEQEKIEEEVRKALRRGLNTIAETIVEGLVQKAAGTYGIRVELTLPGNND